jgi:hypothetical protein
MRGITNFVGLPIGLTVGPIDGRFSEPRSILPSGTPPGVSAGDYRFENCFNPFQPGLRWRPAHGSGAAAARHPQRLSPPRKPFWT